MVRPLQIATHVFTVMEALTVSVTQDGVTGRGEAQGVFYLGETGQSIFEEAWAFLDENGKDLNREKLQKLLRPGGARNAIDCALWDLEARQAGGIWQMLSMCPAPVTTVNTIGIMESPEASALLAAEMTSFPMIKVKLDADRPVERIRAIRETLPHCKIVVDVNTGWTFAELQTYAPQLAQFGVEMIEQPLPRDADQELESYECPVPICADESCLDRADLDIAARRYDIINIKLDKTGGLTEALALANAARSKGLELMVGNFCGSSLAMAPSFVIAQMCRYCDLDGPLALVSDRKDAMTFAGGTVPVFSSALWGG